RRCCRVGHLFHCCGVSCIPHCLMSGRQKKPDARALFKQAKSRKGENGPGGASGAAAPPARAGVTAGKYGGKSKEELLALLRAKQAIAAASKANASAKQQQQQQQQQQRPRPSGESSGSPATPAVASTNHRSADRKPTVKVPVMITPGAGTGRSSVKAGQGHVQAESGGLTGLLGIRGADSSDDDDDDDDDDGNVDNNSTGKDPVSAPPLAPAPAPTMLTTPRPIPNPLAKREETGRVRRRRSPPREVSGRSERRSSPPKLPLRRRRTLSGRRRSWRRCGRRALQWC
ncbi:unnamed protein product, partial [Scytosiphon promiscuus]